MRRGDTAEKDEKRQGLASPCSPQPSPLSFGFRGPHFHPFYNPRPIMEKILQRVRRVERVVGRQKAKKKEISDRAEAWERKQSRQNIRTINANAHRQARKNWQTDWQTGHLAPRRDVGDLAGNKFATRTIYDHIPPDKDPSMQRWLPFAKGDRVVVTHGPDRGRVGYVEDASKEKQAVTVRGLNKHDIFVPAWMQREDNYKAEDTIVSGPAYLPWRHVRLVYPLPDPETGTPKDVIIDRLEEVKLAEDPDFNDDPDEKENHRKIAGSDIIIPWPETSPKPEEEEHDIDTPRITVDEITFRPYLVYPPMPTSVIDELRNKYSKFRTRHTWEFEQKVNAYAERDEKRKNLGKTMRTPLQELADMRARQKAAEERELSEEQLSKIGEVMAQERAGSARTAARQ